MGYSCCAIDKEYKHDRKFKLLNAGLITYPEHFGRPSVTITLKCLPKDALFKRAEITTGELPCTSSD